MTAHRNHASRKPRRWPIFLMTIVLLGATAYFGRQHFFSPPDPAADLQFASVTRGDIEDVVTATGTLQPRDYVDVGAQVSGQLTHIHVEVGQQVKEGDLLAEIDPTVLQSRVDATRASLRNQRAQLKDREASLVLARIQYSRQKNLMAEDATSEEAVQTAEASLKSAEASIEALKAQIDQTESNLRADEANLEYARIYAPMDGTVVSISARQGQTLNTNQQAPTVLRIADLSTMTVQTQVSEADISRLRIGMPAYFTTLGGQGQRWHGELEKIEPTPTVTNNVVLYNALFNVPNPDGRLMTQMTAQVFFITAQARDTLLIPMGALQRNAPRPTAAAAPPQTERAVRPRPPRDAADSPADEARPGRPGTVRVRSADGTLSERPVRYGVSNRVQVQILSGLEEGEQVVSGLAVGRGAAAGGAPRMPRL